MSLRDEAITHMARQMPPRMDRTELTEEMLDALLEFLVAHTDPDDAVIELLVALRGTTE